MNFKKCDVDCCSNLKPDKFMGKVIIVPNNGVDFKKEFDACEYHINKILEMFSAVNSLKED